MSARVSPRRWAMRSAPTYWFGRSMDQEAGLGVPFSPPRTAAPSGVRLIASTPHATPTSIASAAMSPAITCAACCAEPHWASSVRQPAVSGSPACSQAVRVMLPVCSPAWVTQPPATCSTADGSMPARSSRAVCAQPRISAGCMPDSMPLRLPIAVRAASTITAVPIGPPPSSVVQSKLEHVPLSAKEAAVAVPDIPPGFDFTDPEIYTTRVPSRGAGRTAPGGAGLVGQPAPRLGRVRRRGLLGGHQARRHPGGVQDP